jgi:hypothetical protein
LDLQLIHNLLIKLENAGFELRAVAGRLEVDGPVEAMTPERHRLLDEHKAELLAHLGGTASEPAPSRPDSTLPPDLSRDLASWPQERQELWRRRVARIQAETRWPLSRAEVAAYWDVQRWWMFLDPEQRPRTLH